MMLNKQPIFVNSFARGGSNIVWEILQSHPSAVAPIGETDKIIWMEAKYSKFLANTWLSVKGGYPFPKLTKQYGHWMLGYGVFHANNYNERELNAFSRQYLDDLFYRWKQKNIDDEFNRFKQNDVPYTLDELKDARIVAKHVNGMLYLAPALIKMYPDSTHFGLVRNGLALCESRMRRGTFKEASKFGLVYKLMVDKMLDYAGRFENFHMLKFEDLLAAPKDFVIKIYDLAQLPHEDTFEVRLKAKKFVKADGTHDTQFKENNKYWVSVDNLLGFVDPKINENQIKYLSTADRDAFLRIAGKSMEKLGYL